MQRKEFLKTLGAGALFALTAGCFGGCSKDDEDFAPTEDVDFTIDLSDPTYDNLQQNGGYIIKDRVVVAKDNNGNYVAATQRCSHEGSYEIVLRNNEWFCTDHSARFDLSGQGLNSEASRNLTIYQTELNGQMLRVFS